MIDAVGSVLPPALRPKLTAPPETPPAQFQVTSKVSQIDVASQRAASILSRISSPQEEEKPPPASGDDYPEFEVSRGKAVNVTT
ncbi:MAG: hypothetical protein CMH76_10220 [Nitrospinae bacterium]|nr:hypothetical protein [Nitrospinota bacterium]|tara:strand:+ start:205 stop:456 length:252 start_codon:yes stop_codon:yes gene_type:complete